MTAPPSARLVGVDAARGVALLGMMAVHIFPTFVGGEVSLPHDLVSGRAAALFALLAGVSISLLFGRSALSGAPLWAARRALAARAAVVAGVGLLLGLLPPVAAVILVNYALLFLVAALFLGLSTRVLGLVAFLWLCLSPILGHLVRQFLPPGPGPVPSLATFSEPLEFFSHLLFTGYYPVLQWSGYVLLGLWVGRLRLGSLRTAGLLAAGGALLAGVTALVSGPLLSAAGGVEVLRPDLPEYLLAYSGQPLEVVLDANLYGTTPTSTWAWLLVVTPHSGTPLDLLHTSGTSLLVLGLLLFAARWVGRLLLPLSAPGSMTFTLYTLHVVSLVLLVFLVGEVPALPSYLVSAAAAVSFALLWRFFVGKGPLEALAARAGTLAARP